MCVGMKDAVRASKNKEDYILLIVIIVIIGTMFYYMKAPTSQVLFFMPEFFRVTQVSNNVN